MELLLALKFVKRVESKYLNNDDFSVIIKFV